MKRAWQFALMLLLIALAAYPQRYRFEREPRGPSPDFPKASEFHFVRVEYTDLPQFHRGWGYASRDASGTGWWMVDWPDADEHFTTGVRRLTRIDAYLKDKIARYQVAEEVVVLNVPSAVARHFCFGRKTVG